MNVFKIFKRVKPEKSHEDYKVDENNWEKDRFEKNVKDGIQSLFNGKEVRIYNDSRSYEAAIAIKNGYILERNKILSERIHINKECNYISIKMRNE